MDPHRRLREPRVEDALRPSCQCADRQHHQVVRRDGGAAAGRRGSPQAGRLTGEVRPRHHQRHDHHDQGHARHDVGDLRLHCRPRLHRQVRQGPDDGLVLSGHPDHHQGPPAALRPRRGHLLRRLQLLNPRRDHRHGGREGCEHRAHRRGHLQAGPDAYPLSDRKHDPGPAPDRGTCRPMATPQSRRSRSTTRLPRPKSSTTATRRSQQALGR